MSNKKYNILKILRKKIKKDFFWGIIFILPAIWLIGNFKIYPLIRGIYDSFFYFSGGWKREFIGIENYIRMFKDPIVHEAYINALKLITTLPIWIFLPLILAFLIYMRTPGWKFFRAMFFYPYIIAPIIVGQIFREIFAKTGPLNNVLEIIGLDILTIDWLGNKTTVLWVLVSVVLWQFNGFGIVVYLAGFATISEDIFDAAEIDGASVWTKLTKVTIPILRPVIGYWTVISTAGILLWMFAFIFIMTEGGPGHSSTLPEYLVYITSFRFFERGYGVTIGIGLFVLVLVFTLFQVRYMYMRSSGE